MLVQEHYVSYQGTGKLIGVRQKFIRLAGCKVPCPLRLNCDQPDALFRSNGKETEISDLLDTDCEWVHITGGEPTEHPELSDLVVESQRRGFRVHLQTSGIRDITWIGKRPYTTVSPKVAAFPAIHMDEICLVACDWVTPEFALIVTDTEIPVYIVPEYVDGKPCIPPAISLTEVLREHKRTVFLSLQAHLIWGVK